MPPTHPPTGAAPIAGAADPALAALLPAGAVAPRYGGGSIANLAPTLGAWLGVDDGWEGEPVDPAAHPPGRDGAERIVVLVLDGVGARRLDRQLAEDGGALADLIGRLDGRLRRLTSVSPATTSVATTALLGNGASPGRSGMLGFTQRLPRLGLVANMLFWRPAGDRRARSGDLERWGQAPEAFLPTPSLFQTLAGGGVQGRAFLPSAIAGSPLSRMQLRGVEVAGTLHAADLFEQLGGYLAATAGTRAVAYAYLPEFDSLSHRDGPDAPAWPALYHSIGEALARALSRWPASARRGTRLWITADHGLVATPPQRRTLAPALAPLRPLLAGPPAGEARHTYLYAVAGARDELRERSRALLGEDFAVLDGREALSAGLYGDPAALHPEAEERVGDVVVLARGGASLWLDDPATELRGMHGALDAEEMEVPWIGLALDP